MVARLFPLQEALTCLERTMVLQSPSSTHGHRRVKLLERAAKCRDLAATAHTEDARRVLLQMADYYEETAGSDPPSEQLRSKHFR
jgi:hypothetical protein